jgi:hypothetical protein
MQKINKCNRLPGIRNGMTVFIHSVDLTQNPVRCGVNPFRLRSGGGMIQINHAPHHPPLSCGVAHSPSRPVIRSRPCRNSPMIYSRFSLTARGFPRIAATARLSIALFVIVMLCIRMASGTFVSGGYDGSFPARASPARPVLYPYFQ